MSVSFPDNSKGMSVDSKLMIGKRARTLVLCFDGTGGEYDGDITNVIKFYSLLKKDDYHEQLCYYQPGVGTWFKPGVVSPLMMWSAKILDLAFAWYLHTHVIEGYKFLMQNHRVGDRICIFGFSRGAYIARALAGLLHKCGLLPKDNEQQIPFAWKLYKRTDPEGIKLSAGFKQTFCQDVKVDFVGVWDTVASVGALASRTLPFTNSNRSVRVFRHALALDEHRAKFRPNYFHRPPANPSPKDPDPEEGSPILSAIQFDETKERKEEPQQAQFQQAESQQVLVNAGGKLTTQRRVIEVPKPPNTETDVLEVWFPGCHGDVGGGSVSTEKNHSLANISLRWMVGEVMKAQCGILFDKAALERHNIPSVVFPGTSPGELPAVQESDAKDAVKPMHDAMKRSIAWWPLELLPIKYSWQDVDADWHWKHGPNFGKGRNIHYRRPIFHQSVKERMKTGYKPRAKYQEGTERYIS